jgi:hypothetical protein
MWQESDKLLRMTRVHIIFWFVDFCDALEHTSSTFETTRFGVNSTFNTHSFSVIPQGSYSPTQIQEHEIEAVKGSSSSTTHPVAV